MPDVQVGVQVNVAGADQLKELGTNLQDAGGNAKTAGSNFSEFGKTLTGIVASIGLFSNGLFTLADAFDSVERADIRLDKANKTVREALQKRDAIQADLNKSSKEGLTIEKTATGQLVTTIDGQKKLVGQMRDGTLAVKDTNGQWQRLVSVYRDARGNLVATDGVFKSLVTTLKDGSSVYTDAAGNIQVLDDGQKKSKFTVQDLKDANTDLNNAIERQQFAIKQDEKAHAELLPRLLSGATQMAGGAAAALQLGKDLADMGGKAKSAGTDLDTHNKSLGSVLSTIGKVAIPVGAAAAAYLLLKNNVGGSRDALEKLGQQLGAAVPALQPLLKVIGDIGRGILGLGFGNLTQDLKALQDQLAPTFDTLKTKFGEMSNAFQTFIQQIIRGDISGALNTLVQSATKLGTDIFNAIKSVDWSAVWQGLKDAFVSTLEWIKTSASNLGSAIINGIKTTDWAGVWQSLKDAFNSTIEAIKTAASTAGSAIMTALKSVDWAGVWQGLKDAFNSTVDFLKTSASNIGGAIATAVKTFDWKGTGTAIGTAIMSAINFASAASGTVLTALGTAIINGVKTTDWSKVGSEIGTDIIKVITWQQDVISGIFDPLGKLIVDTIAKAIVAVAGNPLSDAISQRIKDEITKIKLPSLQQVADDVWKSFTTALGSGQTATTGAGTGDTGLGQKIVARIQEAVNTIKDTDWSKAASDLWASFTKAIGNFFTSQSAKGATGGQGIPGGLNVIKVPINVDTTEAVKSIGTLTSRFKEVPDSKSTTFNAVTATATANIDSLVQKMGDAQNVLQVVTGQTYTVSVTGNVDTATQAVGGLQSAVTTITQQQYSLTVTANVDTATQAVGGLQNAVTTITQQQYTLTVTANVDTAVQAVGGLQSAVTNIVQQQYTLTVNAETTTAVQAIGGLQSLVTNVVGQNYTLTVNADTGAAVRAMGDLQNVVTTIVNQKYTITINVDTTAAQNAINNLRTQLNSLQQGAAGGGAPQYFASEGGEFALGQSGFRELYAAKGGSFIVNKRTRLGNLTVGEGNRPEMVTFMPGHNSRRDTSMLTVTPLPKLHAQAGGTFGTAPVLSSPQGFLGMFGSFQESAGAPVEYPAGTQPIIQTGGGATGQYGAPNFGAIAGGGSPFGALLPGATVQGETGSTLQQQQQAATQNAMMTAVMQQQQETANGMEKISSLLQKLINMLARGEGFSAKISIDGQRMASVAEKYIGSRSYGDL